MAENQIPYVYVFCPQCDTAMVPIVKSTPTNVSESLTHIVYLQFYCPSAKCDYTSYVCENGLNITQFDLKEVHIS